ncbi:MAG: 2,3-bisphosphoglycerate-independent phosphoglycerate mutase [Cyanobacteria bacterium P01_H01_bin.15]
MVQASVSPVVLVILDGWGYREATADNAIANANKPIINALWSAYPHTLIRTSGKAVGLPDGQMGNSEVGHLNLGAGRVVPQELVRISDAVEDGSLLRNPVLVSICEQVKQANGKLHLIGLCSDGGVHSHLDHLIGLLKLARKQSLSDVCIHAITDGRDTSPKDGLATLDKLEREIDAIGTGRIATISGRYYAMDRDRRWDRVQKAYDVMVTPGGGDGRTAQQVLKDCYEQEITDEFVLPVRIEPGAIEPNDGVIFFNFRPDRARELSYALVQPDFDGFPRERITPLSFASFTQYDQQLDVEVAFKPQNLDNILGQVIAANGLRQFRTAETEKYPHVTYFFNGGKEQPFKGEERELVQSPMVPTYDRAPAMSADAVTDIVCAAIEKGVYSLVVVNYANPDMVGHTGNYDAAVAAIEAVDSCIGRLVAQANQMGGTIIITADHGNAEVMLNQDGSPWTAHTTNPVPLILIEGEGRKIPAHGNQPELRNDGCLADIAPTILEILQINQPLEMTGRSLIKPIAIEITSARTPVQISM